MSEHSDPIDDLGRLAPDVDGDAAAAAFDGERGVRQRRRQVLTGVAAAALVALVAIPAAIGLAGLGDDDAPVAAGDTATSAPPGSDTTLPDAGLAFDVAAVLESTGEEMGTMRAALDTEEYAALWEAFRADSTGAAVNRPTVGFDSSFVLAITIPDDACPPTLERFEAPENAFVPVFVETATECIEPLIPKTYLVAVSRMVPVNPVVFRLPADDIYGLAEYELIVDLDAGTVDPPGSVDDPAEAVAGDLPGEAVDTFPTEGAELIAVAIADGEFIAVHELPTSDSDVVAELLWSDTDIVATGRHRSVDDELWTEVRFQGTVGWAPHRSLLQPLDGSEETVDRLFPDPAERPVADEIGIVARAVIDAIGVEPFGRVATFDFPDDTFAAGTVRVDIIGLGDDSVGGVRLLVQVEERADGGLVLTSVEQTTLCLRGVSDDGCV